MSLYFTGDNFRLNPNLISLSGYVSDKQCLKLPTKRQIRVLFWQKLKISIGSREFQILFNKADFCVRCFWQLFIANTKQKIVLLFSLRPNGQVRSRDLGSNVKKLIQLMKRHNIQTNIDRNFKPLV